MQSQEMKEADFSLVFVKNVIAVLLDEFLHLYLVVCCTCAMTWLSLWAQTLGKNGLRGNFNH